MARARGARAAEWFLALQTCALPTLCATTIGRAAIELSTVITSLFVEPNATSRAMSTSPVTARTRVVLVATARCAFFCKDPVLIKKRGDFSNP